MKKTVVLLMISMAVFCMSARLSRAETCPSASEKPCPAKKCDQALVDGLIEEQQGDDASRFVK